MAGSAAGVQCKKTCVCGPFYGAGKINYPLWWYGEQDVLYNFAGGSATPINCAFINHGYYFNGGSSYLIDEQGRKILREGTTGLWSSINLDGDPPPCGSITGSGGILFMNDGNALPPKIEGSLVLHPLYCPNLTRLYCGNNSISALNVSALTNLTRLHCYNNSISVLDVSVLTNLTQLYCHNNSISVLNVSALTNLAALDCRNNSMDSAMVDTILCDVDGYGTSNGTIKISNNAAPGAAGITCKNNLLARGWTVTTD